MAGHCEEEVRKKQASVIITWPEHVAWTSATRVQHVRCGGQLWLWTLHAKWHDYPTVLSVSVSVCSVPSNDLLAASVSASASDSDSVVGCECRLSFVVCRLPLAVVVFSFYDLRLMACLQHYTCYYTLVFEFANTLN